MKRLTFFIFLTTLFLASCSDPCDDVNCGANGSCDDGICNCDEWFEGTNCETETRGKFLGTWNSTSPDCVDANGDDLSPVWEIEGLANIDGIRFRSPDILGNNWIDANLDNENSATIPTFTLGTLDVSGTLNFVNESSLTLVLDTNVSCTFDLTK